MSYISTRSHETGLPFFLPILDVEREKCLSGGSLANRHLTDGAGVAVGYLIDVTHSNVYSSYVCSLHSLHIRFLFSLGF